MVLRMAPMIAEPSGLERVRGSRRPARDAADDGQDARARAQRGVVILQDQRRRSFRHQRSRRWFLENGFEASSGASLATDSADSRLKRMTFSLLTVQSAPSDSAASVSPRRSPRRQLDRRRAPMRRRSSRRSVRLSCRAPPPGRAE